ncbi:MAG: hypothetical protein C5B59_01205 [Bacteroidetes bacterium]|nr:MAG: hypothetical protein C5B59_01205 [Bacteroidota bacterium]
MGSLDSASLSGLTIKELYGHQLVMPAQTIVDKSQKEKPAEGYAFLGNNEKKITLVVQTADSEFLPDEDFQFISKMLGACKLHVSDVAILNHHRKPVVMGEVTNQLHPKVVMMFGLEPMLLKIPFTMPLFKVQAYDSCSYLYVPALNSLKQDNEEGKLLKSKLWLCLQKLFPVG